MSEVAGLERTFRPGRPLQLGSVVNAFRRGGGDPTSWGDRVGTWVFAWRVPTGPVTLRLVDRPRLGEVEAQALGEGAEWVLERLPHLLGEHDDVWPPALQAEMATRLGAAAAVLPDAGHSPAADLPEATAAQLLTFWAGIA